MRLWQQTQLGEPRPSRPTSVAHVCVLASRGNQRSASMAESNMARCCGPHQGRGDCTGYCAMLDAHERWANRGGGEGPTAALARALDAVEWRRMAVRRRDPRTQDASGFDSDGDEGDADRATGSTASLTKRDQYGVDWDDIDSARRPAMEAARLMHTARHMADTPRWWLMRLPRNATSLLVRTGGLKDDEACKLLRALRVTAVRFGLELASQPKARREP